MATTSDALGDDLGFDAFGGVADHGDLRGFAGQDVRGEVQGQDDQGTGLALLHHLSALFAHDDHVQVLLGLILTQRSQQGVGQESVLVEILHQHGDAREGLFAVTAPRCRCCPGPRS